MFKRIICWLLSLSHLLLKTSQLHASICIFSDFVFVLKKQPHASLTIVSASFACFFCFFVFSFVVFDAECFAPPLCDPSLSTRSMF